VLVVVVLPLLLALTTAWARGWTMADVQTGSMRPGIRPGSMVVLAPIDPADVEQGTVIGFRDDRRGGAVTTHRVTEVLHQAKGLYFRTKGDANTRADGIPVPAGAVVGEVRWRIAGLGAMADAATQRRNQLALVLLPVVLVGVSELLGARDRRHGRKVDHLLEEIARLEAELEVARARPVLPLVQRWTRPALARRATAAR
jgi:signal peptidase